MNANVAVSAAGCEKKKGNSMLTRSPYQSKGDNTAAWLSQAAQLLLNITREPNYFLIQTVLRERIC